MSITFAIERWFDCWRDMSIHWGDHWKEVAIARDEQPLDVDMDAYGQLANMGQLHCLVARDEGIVVGYVLYLVKPHLRYRHTLTCFFDIFYLAPEYRRGMLGMRLLQKAEAHATQLGCRRFHSGSKLNIDLWHIYLRLGWEPTEVLYSKVLPRSEGDDHGSEIEGREGEESARGHARVHGGRAPLVQWPASDQS